MNDEQFRAIRGLLVTIVILLGLIAGKVNGVPLCCECYVAAGHEPADWHPDCVAAYALRKTWR
jgi:hypothetical protein